MYIQSHKMKPLHNILNTSHFFGLLIRTIIPTSTQLKWSILVISTDTSIFLKSDYFYNYMLRILKHLCCFMWWFFCLLHSKTFTVQYINIHK